MQVEMRRYWQVGKAKSNGSRNAMENTKEKSVTGNPCKEEKTKKSNEEEEEKNAHAEIQKEDQLKSAKSKVGEIREENERLKLLLARMMKDYQSLQMHFSNILEQEEAKKSTDTSPSCQDNEELVSLRLGRVSSGAKKDERQIDNNLSHGNEDEKFKEGLTLGLDCRFEFNSTEAKKNPSPENTFKELKEEEPSQMWPPSKILKTTRSEDEEVLQQPNLKKARVSVRARCDTPTMNDGCQWRKYGQKIAKGNPCPRAYYRCTVSPTCPVRKQVQRWSEDMSILITTYEGTHNHPLPISATALASTTSAAASMLQCRSSTSQQGLGNSVSATNSTSTAANLHGLNITFSENAKPHQFYFPNSSISTSNSHPTIVLDLTVPTAFSHFNRLLSTPRYNSPTCLNFSSPSSTNTFEHRTLQTSWSNGYSNYGSPSSYNKNIQVGALNLGNQPPPQEHMYMQMNKLTPPQQSLTETIAATTKVITSNPTFQSALAAAISSYIGNGGGKAQQNLGGGESSDFNFNWGESFPTKPADSSSAQNGIGYGSSFLNKLLSSKNPQQQENNAILPINSLSFPTSKSASGSPVDAEDHVRL